MSFYALFLFPPMTGVSSTFHTSLQDGVPNERKIIKLCEYAAKNPFRIPKVLTLLSSQLQCSIGVWQELLVSNRLQNILKKDATRNFEVSTSNSLILSQRLITSCFVCVRSRCKFSAFSLFLFQFTLFHIGIWRPLTC